MAIFKLLKRGFRGIKMTKEKNNQLNKLFEEKLKSIKTSMDYMNKTHNLKHAFEMEELFLNAIENHSKDQSSDRKINHIETYDVVDKAYRNLKIIDQFPDKKTEINLIDMKKDFFIRHFEKIKVPIMPDEDTQKSINKQHYQLLAKRQNKLQDLRASINSSAVFARVFCTYLARSDYPKKNAFDLLPKEFEHYFDEERNNSLHLKGVKILDSILD